MANPKELQDLINERADRELRTEIRSKTRDLQNFVSNGCQNAVVDGQGEPGTHPVRVTVPAHMALHAIEEALFQTHRDRARKLETERLMNRLLSIEEGEGNG